MYTLSCPNNTSFKCGKEKKKKLVMMSVVNLTKMHLKKYSQQKYTSVTKKKKMEKTYKLIEWNF